MVKPKNKKNTNRKPSAPSQHQIDKLNKVYNLYNELGTLQKVGDVLGVSRERVRQLLQKGNQYGLYLYTTNREKKLNKLVSRIDRNTLTTYIKQESNKFDLCIKLGINLREYVQLIKYYEIDIQGYVFDRKQQRFLNLYMNIVNELGHHPSTTEMQRNKSWRYTNMAISRIWGSFENFRNAFGIEKPPFSLHPNTIASFKKHLEKRSLEKNEKLNLVLQFIRERGLVSSLEICKSLNIKRSTVNLYTRELLGRKLIVKNGSGRSTKYMIS